MNRSVQHSGIMTWDQVCRRNAGRRHYNSWRQAQACQRRFQLVPFMYSPCTGKGAGGNYGWQSAAARALGVSRATICRDAAQLAADYQESRQRRARFENWLMSLCLGP